MGNGIRGMQGTRGTFTRIPGNLLEDSAECSRFSIPRNAREDSGECSRRFLGILRKIPRNVPEDSGECYQLFRGMLTKISENVQEDSVECLERFRGMFRKIPGNAFNFKLIKERSNKMIWYVPFFWNSNWKEIATTMGKSKERKIKNESKQKEKMNQRNQSNIHAFNLVSNSCF